jgi:2-(1,2-epoxy-1,2-dihydrophenyl)acetyl-CoA isomerase
VIERRERGVETRNPEYMTFVEDLFEKAAFIADVGYRLVDASPGRCDSELRVLPRHLQQDGYVHAGVQATMADHTAGAAAGTLIARGEQLLTVEFKINLLRSGRGERLVCEARVLKPGRTLIVVESVVYGLEGEKRALTSKATVTLAALEGRASEGQPRYEVEDGVARLTLARPPRNPIDLPTARDLMRAAIRCDEDERVRAVLISAEGAAFSAGGGIGEFVGAGDELPGLLKEMTVYLHAAVSRLVRSRTPVVCAVGGAVAGGGLSLVLALDLVIAAESASFHYGYSRIGLSPDRSSTYFLPRLLGTRRALEFALTSRPLSAEEAREWGLVNRVVVDTELEEIASGLAAELAGALRHLSAPRSCSSAGVGRRLWRRRWSSKPGCSPRPPGPPTPEKA